MWHNYKEIVARYIIITLIKVMPNFGQKKLFYIKDMHVFSLINLVHQISYITFISILVQVSHST